MNNKEKKTYEIVQYSNSFNALNLSQFKVVENRFLMAFLYKCKGRKSNEEVTLTKSDLIKLEVYKPSTKVTSTQFKRDLISTIRKCATLSFHSVAIWHDKVPEAGVIIPLFSFINYDFTQEITISFAVSIHAEKYLSHLLREFTLFPLHEFQRLNSWYSQMFYRIFKQFRKTGFWKVRKQDFSELLNIPSSYHEGLINSRILNPAVEELKEIFPNLTYRKNMVLVGKNYQVQSYEFHWDPDLSDETQLSKSLSSSSSIQEFELEFRRKLSREEKQKVEEMERTYGTIALIRALDEAACYDKRYLSYIEHLLKSWQEKGLSDEDLVAGRR